VRIGHGDTEGTEKRSLRGIPHFADWFGMTVIGIGVRGRREPKREDNAGTEKRREEKPRPTLKQREWGTRRRKSWRVKECKSGGKKTDDRHGRCNRGSFIYVV
jgi:hypothetical protein